jgi:hypothetical protein
VLFIDDADAGNATSVAEEASIDQQEKMHPGNKALERALDKLLLE